MRTVFLRALEADDKESALRAAIREPKPAQGKQRFEVDTASFGAVPGSPFAYWISERVRGLFKALPRFGTDERTARVGLQSNDDFRWLRAWWEAPAGKLDAAYCVPLAKGGANSPFYADLHTGIRWGADGRWIKAWKADQLDKGLITPNNSKCWNESHYLRPGLTWPHRSATFAAAALPAGCIFGQSGKSAFAPESQLETLLGFFNSSLMTLLARVQSDAVRIKFEVGLVQNTPLSPRVFEDLRVATLARLGWSLKRSLDTCIETSHAFTSPSLLQVEGGNLAFRAVAWVERTRTIESELVKVQAELDERCFALYCIDEADRRAITAGFGGTAVEAELSGDADEAANVVGEDEEADASVADAVGLAAELVSWAVGVVFGRFDLRLPTGARPMPSEPEPFDPLPACSPGMLTGGDGLPLARPPSRYPIAFSEAGVLVNDPGHAQDFPTAVRVVFDVVFGAAADRWWTDVAALLEPKGHDLRVWLASSFFEHHLKRHSKSRRKAPIVWQVGTGSGRYSVWLYAHRVTRDSFFQLQIEVVGPKLAHEERQLTRLIQNAGGSPSAPERKEIAAQEAVVDELRAMLDEVKRIAPLWNPNLDDGVVLTMAPLWRLVPQHKPWQKELKSMWDELAAGKYDWAHIAMHLWPERVVPKCATDRSLAIAHGLEEVFWVKGSDGKWTARAAPVKPLDEIVSERASPAVKAALKSLLEAPTGRASKPSSRSRGYR